MTQEDLEETPDDLEFVVAQLSKAGFDDKDIRNILQFEIMAAAQTVVESSEGNENAYGFIDSFLARQKLSQECADLKQRILDLSKEYNFYFMGNAERFHIIEEELEGFFVAMSATVPSLSFYERAVTASILIRNIFTTEFITNDRELIMNWVASFPKPKKDDDGPKPDRN